MTLLKFEIGTFYAHAQKKNLVISWWCMVINTVSSNFQAKFIKSLELSLDLEPFFCPIPCLNVYEIRNQVFLVFQLFKNVKSFRHTSQERDFLGQADCDTRTCSGTIRLFYLSSFFAKKKKKKKKKNELKLR